MENIDPYLTVVNKQKHFNKKILEELSFEKITDEDGETYIEKNTLQAFKDLQKHLQHEYGMFLSLTSAGRKLKTQRKVLKEQVKLYGKTTALAITAKPGESEHHTGLALDVIPHSKKEIGNEEIGDEEIAAIKNKLYADLHKSLEQFGFILRYTKDKQEITGYPAERWHIRYVGKEHAKEMNQRNMCLEEYVEFIKANNANLAIEDENN